MHQDVPSTCQPTLISFTLYSLAFTDTSLKQSTQTSQSLSSVFQLKTVTYVLHNRVSGPGMLLELEWEAVEDRLSQDHETSVLHPVESALFNACWAMVTTFNCHAHPDQAVRAQSEFVLGLKERPFCRHLLVLIAPWTLDLQSWSLGAWIIWSLV